MTQTFVEVYRPIMLQLEEQKTKTAKAKEECKKVLFEMLSASQINEEEFLMWTKELDK